MSDLGDIFKGFDFLAPTEESQSVASEESPEDATTNGQDVADSMGVSTEPLSEDDDRPRCEDCGIVIEWAGRGRRPKRCIEHRKQSRTASGTRTRVSSGTSRKDARLDSLENKLIRTGVKVGAVIGRYAPITGLVFVERSDRFSSAAVRIAADKPKVLEILEKVADTEPVFEIAEFVASIIFAVGIDLGQVHPESFPAQLLGLTKLWHEYQQTEAQTQQVQEVPENIGVHVSAQAPQFGPGPLPTYTPIGVGV